MDNKNYKNLNEQLSKHIIFGDIHGRRYWEAITTHACESFILIGDFFDSRDDIHPLAQILNFNAIMEFKRTSKVPVHVLIGNHDYHYLHKTDRYSGYQHNYAQDIYKVLSDNRENMQMAHQIELNGEKFLFTHAGVTKTWCDNYGIDKNSNDIATEINALYNEDFDSFEFQSFDPYGDSFESSPIWVRPRSLINNGIDGYTQVNGHTTFDIPQDTTFEKTGKRHVFLDSPKYFTRLYETGKIEAVPYSNYQTL